jgi:hypothetical protein
LGLAIGGRSSAYELKREPSGEESLLRAVVEVALQPASFLIACGEDARAGGAHLGELRAQLRLQACVLERKRCRGGGGGEKDVVLEQRGVVDERRDRSAVVFEEADRPPVRRLGQLETGAVGRDVVELGAASSPIAVRAPLARALGDPSLELAFSLPAEDRYGFGGRAPGCVGSPGIPANAGSRKGSDRFATTSASTYAATTTTRSSRDDRRPLGNASTACAATAR